MMRSETEQITPLAVDRCGAAVCVASQISHPFSNELLGTEALPHFVLAIALSAPYRLRKIWPAKTRGKKGPFSARRHTAVRSTFSSSPTVQDHNFATNARHIQPRSTQLTPFDFSRTTPITREAQANLWFSARCHLSLCSPAARRGPAVLPSCRLPNPPAPFLQNHDDEPEDYEISLHLLGHFSVSWLSWPTQHNTSLFIRGHTSTLCGWPDAACMCIAMGSGRTCQSSS
ncbi:uncharacterized protein LY79DRAFT_139191 [Colletotrichum navitas]|uniref:Uncharacterized protein n=1 Tax=Colletotrichum navitas TaxID=681940 RepID=A0AAD8QB93_9PEZI|nr:uncharacterized protein LY79DRAFT_139191 [Colletotrichum navitas]KAK1599386.1 hypothetical protein LY79DRAFT_139191 [Colletotrichum navitas]